MSLPGQNIQSNRYTVIPRTLSFLLHDQRVLLIRFSEEKGHWAGKLNGIGGHIEPGESAHASAKREILEETGLQPARLRMCGTVLVSPGEAPGIGIFVFVGEVEHTKTTMSSEGELEWVPIDQLDSVPLVEDLPLLFPEAMKSFETGVPFSALTTFDDAGMPVMIFNR